ncbi:type II toxin-antitoxin system HicA family toxin [Bilifractor sp. LCP19S3_H10]|uniref:type II toxin-antitoxin system HicA family toxin n=1 Tax=Bilifractor sp. LCP19S3_H10 TaxID=3438736 RepID=UPI003F8E248B
MSQWDKLIRRILDLNNDLRFTELQKVLLSYGYVCKGPRKGSSHYTFRKNGFPVITIPKHDPIKRIYVEMVRDAILREENDNEDY